MMAGTLKLTDVNQVFVNVIIANLMVATHYGLGLHIYAVNYHDADYPSNVSRTFKVKQAFISPGFKLIPKRISPLTMLTQGI